MATNPRYPEQRQVREHPRTEVAAPRGRSPWPLITAIIALAIIAALIWWLSSSPNRVKTQTSVTGQNVELTDLKATTPTASGATDVSGTIVNHGNTALTGVTVDATFRNIQNHKLETISGQLEPQSGSSNAAPKGAPAGSQESSNAAEPTHGFKNPGGSAGEVSGGQGAVANGGSSAPGFADAPIKPGQSDAFVLHLQRVPEGWTGGVPELKITSVQTTAK